MKYFKFLPIFLFSFAILVPLISFSQNTYSRISLNVENITKLSEIGIPVEDGFVKKDKFIIDISQNEIAKLENLDVEFEIFISDVTDFYQKRIANSLPSVRTSKTPDNFNLGSLGGNLTYSEVLDELDDMQELYPNLITVKQSISDITSHEGNSIFYVKISDNPAIDEEESELLYTGMHHAREPVSMMHLIYYMWYLLENYETDVQVQYMVDNFEQYFIPVVNPDGYLYNEQTNPNGGGMWRKNMRDNQDGTMGVDLNRNYPYQWAYDNDGSSPYTDEDTYRGPSGGSEPETQAMMEFVGNHDFLIANNHHTYSNLMLYPYGYSEDAVNPEIELFEAYAQIMTRINHFACGRSWELLYSVNGEADDWFYNEHGIYAFTAETGTYEDGFWPETNNIIPLCEDNLEMNFLQTLLAGPYAEVTETNTNNIKRVDYFNFDIKFLGLDQSASFKVFLSGDNIDYSDTIIFSDYELLEVKVDSLSYIVSNNVDYGTDFNFYINVDNGFYVEQKELTKTIQATMILVDDDANNMDLWTSNNWSLTSDDFHSPSFSITDSEGNNYSSNANSEITSNTFDFSNNNETFVSFWAKWNIEADWDYVQFLISDDGGSNWTALESENTQIGEGGVQPTGEPVFDGNSEWVNEIIDISDYLSSDVKFKFVLGSDGYLEYDGFYFDDFQVYAGVDNLTPQITGQYYVNVPINQVKTIDLSDIIVEDGDNIFPNDFTLIVNEGEHYSIGDEPNQIIPETDYLGVITIPIQVCDGYSMSNTYNLQANVSTSVKDIEKYNFQIYPNPAKDYINIVAEDEKFTEANIIDITGKVLKSVKIEDKITQITLEYFDAGVYFVQLKGKSFKMQKVLIIE